MLLLLLACTEPAELQAPAPIQGVSATCPGVGDMDVNVGADVLGVQFCLHEEETVCSSVEWHHHITEGFVRVACPWEGDLVIWTLLP